MSNSFVWREVAIRNHLATISVFREYLSICVAIISGSVSSRLAVLMAVFMTMVTVVVTVVLVTVMVVLVVVVPINNYLAKILVLGVEGGSPGYVANISGSISS